jgi:hypothetical protein
MKATIKTYPPTLPISNITTIILETNGHILQGRYPDTPTGIRQSITELKRWARNHGYEVQS